MTAIETPRGAGSSWAVTAFLAMCRRDLSVVRRDLLVFLAQVLVQPVFFLFIFGRILPQLGFASANYATLLLPGIVALTIVMTGLQSTVMPLVIEFGWTREIEDRLLAPLPVTWVAVQKVVMASGRGLLAGLVIFPLGALIIGSTLHVSGAHPLEVLGFCLLAALVGSVIGLALGTHVDVNQINIMFAVILTPLMFTGCTQYPWAYLGHLRWFQILTLANPMTYASEGLRAALVPGMAHMNAGVAAAMLCVSIAVLGYFGIRGFVRKAVD